MPFTRKRYTRNDLRADLVELNKALSETGYHFEAEGRNGYTGLDLYKGRKCINNIEAGTPRECYNKACEYQSGLLADYVESLKGTQKSPVGPM